MELCEKTAAELAGLLRKGEIGSRDITESVFRRIDEKEDIINAYISTTREIALHQADQADKRFKKKQPILDENVRVKMLNSLKHVDYALLGNEGPDKIKIIEELQPDIVALGYDQWINEEKLKQELVKRGFPNIQVIRLPKYGSNGYSSSTEIRNKIISSHK